MNKFLTPISCYTILVQCHISIPPENVNDNYMFKVENRNIDVILISLLLVFNIIHIMHCSAIFIVDFEQVNPSWVCLAFCGFFQTFYFVVWWFKFVQNDSSIWVSGYGTNRVFSKSKCCAVSIPYFYCFLWMWLVNAV